jgi:hypothetical protein
MTADDDKRCLAEGIDETMTLEYFVVVHQLVVEL